jgi:hypothetical protein
MQLTVPTFFLFSTNIRNYSSDAIEGDDGNQAFGEILCGANITTHSYHFMVRAKVLRILLKTNKRI